MQQIIAIGGMSKDARGIGMMKYVLSQSGVKRPKVCFLPQASAENTDHILGFYQACNHLKATPSWLSLFGRVPRNWQDQLADQDVIFVGGGNTRSMLALWREWGVDEILKKILRKGTVLAGVSAGAICWFEEGVTDSIWPLGNVKGLGFLKGSCCPHYDSEMERRPAFLKWVQRDKIKPGIALQEGTAAHYIDGKLHKIVSVCEGNQAFRLTRRSEAPLAPHLLFVGNGQRTKGGNCKII